MNKIARWASLALAPLSVALSTTVHAQQQAATPQEKHRQVCAAHGAQSPVTAKACFEYGRDVYRITNPQGIDSWCRSHNNGCPKTGNN